MIDLAATATATSTRTATAPVSRASALRRALTATRSVLLTEITLVNAFRVTRPPLTIVDLSLYRDLADLFEATEDDEADAGGRDCDGLRRLADSLEFRPRRLRNAR